MLGAITAQLQASKSGGEGVPLADSVAQLNGAADMAAARVTECRSDFWLGLVMQRGAAVRRYVDEFIGIGRGTLWAEAAPGLRASL